MAECGLYSSIQNSVSVEIWPNVDWFKINVGSVIYWGKKLIYRCCLHNAKSIYRQGGEHSSQQKRNKRKTTVPLKSIGNPDTGLLSLDSDIAFVTTLFNLTEDDMSVLLKGWIYDIWEPLASLAHEAPLELAPRIAAPALTILREEEMQGLAVAIWRPEAAVAAILDKNNFLEENWDLQNI
jgi:hypothetical protein